MPNVTMWLNVKMTKNAHSTPQANVKKVFRPPKTKKYPSMPKNYEFNLHARMLSVNFDALDEMLALFRRAQDDNKMDLQFRILKELLEYCAPKLTAVNHTGKVTVSYEDALKSILVPADVSRETIPSLTIIDAETIDGT